MAKLEVRTTPPVVPVEEYILTLTKEEAEVVMILVGQVTGSSHHSRRGYADNVFNALSTCLGHVPHKDLDGDNFFSNVVGLSIYPEGK